MKKRACSFLLCSLTILAHETGNGDRLPSESFLSNSQSTITVVTGGGARISKTEAERLIQERENRITPTAKRRDFSLEPTAVQGWAFTRKSIQALLDSMKDKSDNATIYVTLGHEGNVDDTGKPIPGSWHETVILSESRPFSPLASSYDFFLQYPTTWP